MFRFTAIAVLVALCFAGRTEADLQRAIDATCRVKAQDGGTGTGCVVAETDTHLCILTNAHVAATREVSVEFWLTGHRSRRMRGNVAWRMLIDPEDIDAAIVHVAKADFGGAPVPKPVPIDPTYETSLGEHLVSVGCPKGSWPTLMSGHATEGRAPHILEMRPPCQGGRSGSAVFTADGTRVVGLIAWRSGHGTSVAQRSRLVISALNGTRQAPERPYDRTRHRAIIQTQYCQPPAGGCYGGYSDNFGCPQCPQPSTPYGGWESAPPSPPPGYGDPPRNQSPRRPYPGNGVFPTMPGQPERKSPPESSRPEEPRRRPEPQSQGAGRLDSLGERLGKVEKSLFTVQSTVTSMAGTVNQMAGTVDKMHSITLQLAEAMVAQEDRITALENAKSQPHTLQVTLAPETLDLLRSK